MKLGRRIFWSTYRVWQGCQITEVLQLKSYFDSEIIKALSQDANLLLVPKKKRQTWAGNKSFMDRCVKAALVLVRKDKNIRFQEQEHFWNEKMSTPSARKKSLTFLVLSIAFNIETFKSSKAARTFSYSPRCWEKYSTHNTKWHMKNLPKSFVLFSRNNSTSNMLLWNIAFLTTQLFCVHIAGKKKDHSVISTAHGFINIMIWNWTEKTISIRLPRRCEVAKLPAGVTP